MGSAISFGGSGGLKLIGQQAATLGTETSLSVAAIPDTFTNLVVDVALRGTTAGNIIGGITFNGDNTASYSSQRDGGDGNTASAFTAVGTANSRFIFPGSDYPANQFAKYRSLVTDYTNTDFIKSLDAAGGMHGIGVFNFSVLWDLTSVIDEIGVTTNVGALAVGSYIRVYGE